MILRMQQLTERAEPASVARACLAAHRDQDWERLRTLFHPKARIGTFAGGGHPEEPETALRRLQMAHSDLIYHAEVGSLVELNEEAVLLKGSVRSRSPKGGWHATQRAWLYVVRGGLLYRSAVYETPHQARAEYERLGSTLGVAD
jgi:hypothetical protein